MQFLRWQIISTFDILFEVGLVGMAVYLVWGLQTSLDNKMTVTLSFASRLPYVSSKETQQQLINY
jgi:hypothetical protein